MTAQADSASLNSAMQDQRRSLRRTLRQRRRQFTRSEQRSHAMRVAQHLVRAGILQRGARIGVYLALPEELSLAPFIKQAHLRHRLIHLPHIQQQRQRRLAFVPWHGSRRLRPHPWGMLTCDLPYLFKPTDVRTLDVLLLPLTGFDDRGQRLGMGGGFYDRLLARRTRSGALRRPLLIGVAHAVQHIAHLPNQRHDVALDAVVTETGLRRFTRP